MNSLFNNSTTSERSNSQKSKMFDSFISQLNKPPTPDQSNKENIRQNYHQQLSSNKVNSSNQSRSNSTSVIVIKALQDKIKDQQTSFNEKVKDKDNSISQLQNLYAQMQKQYQQLEMEHNNLKPNIAKYQLEIQLLKANQDQQSEEMKSFYLQLSANFKKLQTENHILLEKINTLQTDIMEKDQQINICLSEMKKEKQNVFKLKQDYIKKIDENDQEFEQQIEYYQKVNQQLQNQVQKLIMSEANCDKSSQKAQQQHTLEKQQLHVEIEKLRKECQDQRDQYKRQITKMEQDLKDLYNDCNEKNSVTLEENDTLKMRLQKLEKENFETLAIKDQENFKLIKSMEQIKQDIKILQNQLQEEKMKNNLFMQQIKIKINQREQVREKSPVNPKLFKNSQVQDAVSWKQQMCQELTQTIQDAEKRTTTLNQEYQQLFTQYNGDSGNSAHLKQQMNLLMEKMKLANQELYELKSQEYSFFANKQV